MFGNDFNGNGTALGIPKHRTEDDIVKIMADAKEGMKMHVNELTRQNRVRVFVLLIVLVMLGTSIAICVKVVTL